MKTTKTGDLAEAKFKVLCLENNINVLEPIGNNSPYDVVLDINGRFLRIQIKQGWISKKDSRAIFANVGIRIFVDGKLSQESVVQCRSEISKEIKSMLRMEDKCGNISDMAHASRVRNKS